MPRYNFYHCIQHARARDRRVCFLQKEDVTMQFRRWNRDCKASFTYSNKILKRLIYYRMVGFIPSILFVDWQISNSCIQGSNDWFSYGGRGIRAMLSQKIFKCYFLSSEEDLTIPTTMSSRITGNNEYLIYNKL